MQLKIENLSFGYTAKKQVLKDISFSATSGRNLFILGPNGAGKSTLVANILQFVKNQSGNIFVDDKDLSKLKPKEKAKLISYVPQNVAFPSMTAFDAVLLGRRPYIKWDASSNDYKIVESIFEELGIEEFALRDVSKLSGGEKQKIAIARALAQSTPVVLFDELTSNLDIKNQIDVLSFITKLVKDKNLVSISIVHDINLALRFADDILLLKDGHIEKFGTIETLENKDINNTFNINAQILDISGKKIITYGDDYEKN